MRRGRTLTYLVLLVIVVVAVGGLYFWSKNKKAPATSAGTPTPEILYVNIVTAGEDISANALITEEMLTTVQIPEAGLPPTEFTDISQVAGKYARQFIRQGDAITDVMISIKAGNENLPGSIWASYIPQGLTAVSIPVSRLSSAAFGIRDGDYVNVIVTMLLVDIDPATQSLLPNLLANIETDQTTGTVTITQGDVIQGHFEQDEVSNMVIYLQPSEPQRPRLVTQMIMQNVQVLHMGTFALPGEPIPDQFTSSAPGATATPVPANQQPAVVAVVRPDVVTLMVTPQDAVALTYLVFSGVKITLTLRNPDDQQPVPQPDAADLAYLLTQYNIPVPAKINYALQPRVDALTQPVLGNDAAP